MEGVIAIIFGLGLFYIAFKFKSKVKKIAKKGIQTDGVVFDVVQSNTSQSLATYPIIRFVTSKKEWITEKYNVSTIPGLLEKGQKVIVVYDPDNPKEFFIKSSVTSAAPFIVYALAIILTAIGLYKLLHIQF